MSYILEALKKAQAERQLGEVPSVHAPSMHMGAEEPAGGKLKKPVVIGMTVMAGVIVVLLALVWRGSGNSASSDQARLTPRAVAAPAPQPATVPTTATAPTPVPAPVPALVATPIPAQPAVLLAPAPSPKRAAATPPPDSATTSPEPVATAPAPAPQEEVTQTVRDLPEPIQRSLPQVAVGGYIYSKNPADRLLLVDKVLRHEGEEVAPGLVLEKLLPKSAVFSFKGYRYRVPY